MLVFWDIFSSFLAILQQLSITLSLSFCLCVFFSWKYGILKVSAAFCMLLITTEHYKVVKLFWWFSCLSPMVLHYFGGRSTVFMVICVVCMIFPWCCPISDDMFVLFSSFLAILQQLSIMFSLWFCLCNLFYLKYGILKVLAAYCMLLSTTEVSMFLWFSCLFPTVFQALCW